jgi:hypothetical protein
VKYGPRSANVSTQNRLCENLFNTYLGATGRKREEPGSFDTTTVSVTLSALIKAAAAKIGKPRLGAEKR